MTDVPSVAIGAAQFYRSKGISKDAAVAIVSCLWYESKLKPGSQGTQSTETPGTLNPGGAYGIASWNGPRQATLAGFAAKKGLNVSDLNTQLAFVLTESANSYPGVWTAINSDQPYSQIIPVFVAEYENPKDHQSEINAAMAFASGLYSVLPDIAIGQTLQPQEAPSLTSSVIGTVLMDPVIIDALTKLLAPMAESLITGLIKGLTQHMSTQSQSKSPTQFPLPLSTPSLDLSSLGTIIAKELSTLIPTMKG